jgi:predicted metal-dependent phosphoesterase TrpH
LVLSALPICVLAVEFHTHTERSYDGRDPVEDLLERAATVGLDALAVTDHDDIEASLNAQSLAADYGLVAIPGLEVSSADGHVLALGVEQQVPAGLSFRDTVSQIRDYGGIAVVPHPFQESRHGVLANISKEELATADAIEVYNSRLLTGRSNRQAERFAQKRELPMTAGSDAHISRMVGQAVTHVDADERSADAILDAVLDGATKIEGKRTPWRISFQQAASSMRRRLKYRVNGFLK